MHNGTIITRYTCNGKSTRDHNTSIQLCTVTTSDSLQVLTLLTNRKKTAEAAIM